MKITRIEVEGARGGACIERRDMGRGAVIVAQDAWGRRHFFAEAGLRSESDQAALARTLQANLDGYRGTRGDVAGYLRLVEMLAD